MKRWGTTALDFRRPKFTKKKNEKKKDCRKKKKSIYMIMEFQTIYKIKIKSCNIYRTFCRQNKKLSVGENNYRFYSKMPLLGAVYFAQLSGAAHT